MDSWDLLGVVMSSESFVENGSEAAKRYVLLGSFSVQYKYAQGNLCQGPLLSQGKVGSP